MLQARPRNSLTLQSPSTLPSNPADLRGSVRFEAGRSIWRPGKHVVMLPWHDGNIPRAIPKQTKPAPSQKPGQAVPNEKPAIGVRARRCPSARGRVRRAEKQNNHETRTRRTPPIRHLKNCSALIGPPSARHRAQPLESCAVALAAQTAPIIARCSRRTLVSSPCLIHGFFSL